jgi:putative addiction module component (TIGR02574 family)
MSSISQDELVRLTAQERLALISQIWDSLEDGNLPVSIAQRAELDRRLSTVSQDRKEGIAWATLQTELEKRCP